MLLLLAVEPYLFLANQAEGTIYYQVIVITAKTEVLCLTTICQKTLKGNMAFVFAQFINEGFHLPCYAVGMADIVFLGEFLQQTGEIAFRKTSEILSGNRFLGLLIILFRLSGKCLVLIFDLLFR